MDTPQAPRVEARALLKQKMKREPSRLLVWLVKRLICQDWYNRAFAAMWPAEGVDFMVRSLRYLGVTVTAHGLENLPPAGTRCTFVCNHPLGGVDVLAAVSVVAPRYPEGLLIPANDLLAQVPALRPLIIPVNKTGGQSRSLPEAINRAFASSSQLMFYPSGKVSRRHPDGIYDDAWQKNFVVKSVEYDRVVVPILIEARNSRFFYALAAWRKRLGVRLNLEMLLLPREVRGQRGKTLRLTVGEPIPAARFDASRPPAAWAEEVRRSVYALARS